MHSIRMVGQNLCKARLNRSPNSRRLNGKIVLALVHDFKKVDDETAVVVE